MALMPYPASTLLQAVWLVAPGPSVEMPGRQGVHVVPLAASKVTKLSRQKPWGHNLTRPWLMNLPGGSTAWQQGAGRMWVVLQLHVTPHIHTHMLDGSPSSRGCLHTTVTQGHSKLDWALQDLLASNPTAATCSICWHLLLQVHVCRDLQVLTSHYSTGKPTANQAHSLQTALLLTRPPSVRLEVGDSSRPDWHLRHLANLLKAGAYSVRLQGVATPGMVCAYPASDTQSALLRAPLALVTMLGPHEMRGPRLSGCSVLSPPGQKLSFVQRVQDVAEGEASYMPLGHTAGASTTAGHDSSGRSKYMALITRASLP
jgi:hypothetical protein